MNLSQRRALLEAIALSADPSLKPTDRMRALELIDRLGDGPPVSIPEHYAQEVMTLGSHEIDTALDSYLAGELLQVFSGHRSFRLPETAAVIEVEVERRAGQRAARWRASGTIIRDFDIIEGGAQPVVTGQEMNRVNGQQPSPRPGS